MSSSSIVQVTVPGYVTTWNYMNNKSDRWLVDFKRMMLLDENGDLVQLLKREECGAWRWKTHDLSHYWHRMSNTISESLEKAYNQWLLSEILKE